MFAESKKIRFARTCCPVFGMGAFVVVFTSLLGPGCGDNWIAPKPGLDAGGASDGNASDGGAPDGGLGGGYSIVVLPDTQFYASRWPDIFAAQTQWIIENRQTEGIAFVLHTGDIVDVDDPIQWDRASQSLHVLDGQVPYVITAGNHDYKTFADRMGMGSIYFPVSGFAASSWFRGTFEPEHIENSYSVFNIGAEQWLVIALEFGPRDEALAWADAILKQHSDAPAIVITHAYLAHDGQRYDHTNPASPRFNPHDYAMAGQPASSINDGEEMWRKLIAPNSNVKLVFSGHDVSGVNLPPGTAALLTSTRPDGTRVHQVLANYQTCLGPPCETFSDGTTTQTVHGGDGYLRLLRFSPTDHTISVRTYSPYVDRSLSDPANQFVLDMN
jgi:hypothetical protein